MRGKIRFYEQGRTGCVRIGDMVQEGQLDARGVRLRISSLADAITTMAGSQTPRKRAGCLARYLISSHAIPLTHATKTNCSSGCPAASRTAICCLDQHSPFRLKVWVCPVLHYWGCRQTNHCSCRWRHSSVSWWRSSP